MTDELNTPVFQSPDATTPLASVQEAFCRKVKREIKRFGVEKALSRWRVMCDYMQTEDWWPFVARKVEAVIDDAFEERDRREQAEHDRQRQAEQQRQQAALVNVLVSQLQSNRQEITDNNFENGRNSQVFNSDVNGHFEK